MYRLDEPPRLEDAYRVVWAAASNDLPSESVRDAAGRAAAPDEMRSAARRSIRREQHATSTTSKKLRLVMSGPQALTLVVAVGNFNPDLPKSVTLQPCSVTS